MQNMTKFSAVILGISVFFGLSSLGYLLGDAAIRFKEFERTVTVKGLAERELPADIVIWPIRFSVADNNLESLYSEVEGQMEKIRSFLVKEGIAAGEITLSAPTIIDKSAQSYSQAGNVDFRYAAVQIVTVYSGDINLIRSVMGKLSQLGRQGIAFTGDEYQAKAEYLFTRLNDIKPGMIEEATTKAREVAMKFAEDSRSSLGKIKRAQQGQFSIRDRDKNNPHIKTIRIVATVEYYLSD